jgi:hypothetical protein
MNNSVYQLVESHPLHSTDIDKLWQAAIRIVAGCYELFHDSEFHLKEVAGEEDMDSLLEALRVQEKAQYR